MSGHKFFFDEDLNDESNTKKLTPERVSEILAIAIDSVEDESVADDLCKLRIKLKRNKKWTN
jgi:hypothetical protein